MSSYVGERVSRVEVRRSGAVRGPFGLSAGEMVAALAALLFFVLVVTYYFTSLKPEQDRLRLMEDRLKGQMGVLEGVAASGGAAQPQVDTAKDALNSLEAFKAEHLKPMTPGRTALFGEINALAKKHSLQLTSGVDMRLEMPDKEAAEKSSRQQKESARPHVFPSVEVRFTVFGPYQNMRSFINELEQSKQFLVLNSIDLKTVEEIEAEGQSRRAASVSGVSLTIGLSVYYHP
jgi:hypothetical protein